MPSLPYVYNASTGLWHALRAVEIDGEITTAVDQSGGVPTPPPYIAAEDEPLITTDMYLWATNQSSLGMDPGAWAVHALVSSDLVERSCRYSWRCKSEATPILIADVVARITRDRYAKASKIGSALQSESMTGYSYSARNDIDPNDLLSPYESILRMFRQASIWA